MIYTSYAQKPAYESAHVYGPLECDTYTTTYQRIVKIDQKQYRHFWPVKLKTAHTALWSLFVNETSSATDLLR